VPSPLNLLSLSFSLSLLDPTEITLFKLIRFLLLNHAKSFKKNSSLILLLQIAL
jgi:hypothetical protein